MTSEIESDSGDESKNVALPDVVIVDFLTGTHLKAIVEGSCRTHFHVAIEVVAIETNAFKPIRPDGRISVVKEFMRSVGQEIRRYLLLQWIALAIIKPGCF